MKKHKITIYIWTYSDFRDHENKQVLNLTFDELKHHFRTGLKDFKPKNAKQAINHLNAQNNKTNTSDRRVHLTIH